MNAPLDRLRLEIVVRRALRIEARQVGPEQTGRPEGTRIGPFRIRLGAADIAGVVCGVLCGAPLGLLAALRL